MSDYKMEIQEIAEEIAQDEYGKDFYSLTSDEQYQVYLQAQERWSEKYFGY